MPYQEILVDRLVVNPENDRHGPLFDEKTSILWHFDNLGDAAIKLATDIVGAKQIFEHPLVSPDGKRFVVRDGNRRMTCLKCLLDPSLLANTKFHKSFEALSSKFDKKKARKILCRVEEDEHTINEIVHRRHTGGTSGVGQVKWDAFAKENHLNRIGKSDKKSIGVAVATYAETQGIIDNAKKVPSSTLFRLLSSKAVRERLGIKIDGDQISFLSDEKSGKQVLKQILEDLMSREITLRDLWNNADKNAYLDRLKKEGFSVDTVKVASIGKTKKNETKGAKKAKVAFDVRQTLIPKNIIFDCEQKKPGLAKIWRVWNELQYKLYIDRTPCAVGVMFRCLIWFSVDYYISCNGLRDMPSELKGRVKKAAEDMKQRQFIDDAYLRNVKSFADSEKLVSIGTTHQWVHSRDLVPDERYLRQMWEAMERFLCICLKIEIA